MPLVVAACGSSDKTATQVTTPPDTTAKPFVVSFPGGADTALIASTVAQRDNGLMNVTNLAPNAGMLFVWGTIHDSLDVSFWMKDTPIDLSIAFISANMTVVNVDEMVAEDSVTLHKPKGLFKYALEANKGWMTAHGVAAGTLVTFSLPAGTIIDP